VISFTPRPITLGVNTPASVGYVSLGASQRQSGLCGEERNLFTLPGIPTFYVRPAKNLVTILSFLNYPKKTYNKLHV
jgi:hypothetical protein